MKDKSGEIAKRDRSRSRLAGFIFMVVFVITAGLVIESPHRVWVMLGFALGFIATTCVAVMVSLVEDVS